jgi:hypothetical protein
MSEEKKPRQRPAASQQQSPPPGGPQMQAAMRQAQNTLNQLGIDNDAAIKTLLVAVVFGLVGAILDKILELPTESLLIYFGVWAAVLCGPVYAFFMGRDNLAGVVMAALTGFVALLVWWIVTKLIGDRGEDPFTYNPADMYNLLEVLLTGVIAGLLGFGWFALLRRLESFKILR